MSHVSKSLYLTAPYTLIWKEETLPPLARHEILLETIAGSISIGTELPQYRGDERSNDPLAYPRMTGYENYARVIKVGEAVTKFAVNDTVFAFYGHRSHAILHEDQPIRVPSSISAEDALSAILTCDVTKGIRKLKPLPDSRILVTGGGAIGLYTIAMLKAYGVMQVDVVEPLDARRQLARELGATNTYDLQDAFPDDYDMGFECSSRQSAFALLQTHLAHQGKLCILADGNVEPLILLPEFHHNELTIVASSDGWDYHRHARWFFEVVQKQKPPLSKLFDVHISPEQLPETFASLADGSLSAIKVLVDYQSE